MKSRELSSKRMKNKKPRTVHRYYKKKKNVLKNLKSTGNDCLGFSIKKAHYTINRITEVMPAMYIEQGTYILL